MLNVLAVGAEDDVAGLEAGLIGGRAANDCGNTDAAFAVVAA